MGVYHLAVDIGASSGRHILGWKENGKLVQEEVYRFENGMENKDGYLCWNTKELFASILAGMKRCKEIGKVPTTMGIDTWAVDFALLDKDDRVLGNTVGYRDKRTTGMDDKVYEILPLDQLYARTGIQKQIFNTVYQLMAVKQQTPEYLEQAETFLMIPDYFHFLLTGEKCCEYTNATTTQLVSPVTKEWDFELLEMLGYPAKIFPKIALPGTLLGNLLPEIQAEVGYDCQVVLPATHDTGSAVLAVPALQDKFLYISSGTWSLMGTELRQADCSPESMAANLTNEGGYEYRFRYLKNIMGLWMIQSLRRDLGKKHSFAELCEMAEECKDFASRVDVDAARFLSPDCMLEEIQAACKESGQTVPQTPGELACVIYQSLAECYGRTAEQIEALTGEKYAGLYIVGGGSNAEYLNQLTANATGKTVYAGPGEATAFGNLLVQMLYQGEFENLEAARKCIFDSFPMKCYEPQSK
ncbi:MAG: rhamnulokinase [Lachnospiraceae bacterium]|nr:rhamnulokinase [Lachnospiraceae bacterium]